MNDLISIFNMKEISVETRIEILLRMCNIINSQYGSNICEPIVYEFVKILNPEYKFEEIFLRLSGVLK
jgi:hypothetical protein